MSQKQLPLENNSTGLYALLGLVWLLGYKRSQYMLIDIMNLQNSGFRSELPVKLHEVAKLPEDD